MPFRHPDRPRTTSRRVIEHEVRERLEEAIDFVCLDALVARAAERAGLSRARRRPNARRPRAGVCAAPVPGLPCAVLDAEVPASGCAAPPRPPPTPKRPGCSPPRSPAARAVCRNYWQRFETLRARGSWPSPCRSGGERRGVLARLFGHSLTARPRPPRDSRHPRALGASDRSLPSARRGAWASCASASSRRVRTARRQYVGRDTIRRNRRGQSIDEVGDLLLQQTALPGSCERPPASPVVGLIYSTYVE